MKEKYIHTGRTNQKQETRNKILASAKFFLNAGQEFNLEDVAKKSGISRATVYRYYSSLEVLAIEASLDISTKSPEIINNELKDNTLDQKIIGIQDYFNALSLRHENTFRQYLSTAIVPTSSEIKRGARRKKTLQLVLEDSGFTSKEKTDLSNLLTILMGIEPLIITKDVCGLNNQDSLKLLKWGMELVLKGFEASKNKPLKT